MSDTHRPGAEIAGGLEAAIQGITSAIGPIILFAGVLGAPALNAGYWATLVTAIVVSALPLVLRGNPALIGGARPASLAVYTGIVFQLCDSTAGALPTAEQLAIGLAAGSLVLMLAGLIVLASGLLRLGNLFRMIPDPVSAGIANATALILVGLAVRQFSHDTANSLIVCALMVACYWAWQRLHKRGGRPGWIPPVIVGIAIGVAAVVALGGQPAHGNMPDPAQSWAWASFHLWPALRQAHWSHLLAVAVPGAVTLALVVTLETFTTAGAMEARFGLRVDYNRELIVMGWSNLASALLGGVPSSVSPARSVASWLAGGRGAKAYVVFLLLTALCLLGLANWLVALPAGIMAGMLVMQAHVVSDPLTRLQLLGLLRRDGQRRGTGDLGFWLVVTIALTGFLGNMVWATFAGIALSSLIVLRRVSRNVVARWEYLDEYRSVRVRSAAEEAVLARFPQRAAVLRLSGHLFFGNSFRVTQLAREIHPEARAAIVELSRVQDTDASGTAAVVRLVCELGASQRSVILAGLDAGRIPDVCTALRREPQVVERADLDRALETAEDQLLMQSTVMAAPLMSKPVASNQLLEGLSQEEITAVLMLAAQRQTGPREWLFRKGEVSDGVLMLEEGVVSIHAAMDAASRRLATFAPGQFIGEMSLVDGHTRSASAWAETPVRGHVLDKAALEALLEHHPQAALGIMRNISRALSLRMRTTSALLTPEQADDAPGWNNSSIQSRF